MTEFSHYDEQGRSKMVDVSEKKVTDRRAVAGGRVKVTDKVMKLITSGEIEKGNVREVARVAGIMGGKKTPELIPMCHPLLLEGIEVKFALEEEKNLIHVYTMVKNRGKTGVEMEALTAASTTCLTVYDMCKSVDKGIEIENIKLLKKTGGKSGTYLASDLTGEIINICISEKKGTAKKQVPEVLLQKGHGIEGDAHAGQPRRQVSLLAGEDIAEMKNKVLELSPGDFGENIITKGLNLLSFPVGTYFKLGEEVVLKLTQRGKECHDRCEIYHQVGDCIMPRRGIFAEVVQGGQLTPETEIEVILDD